MGPALVLYVLVRPGSRDASAEYLAVWENGTEWGMGKAHTLHETLASVDNCEFLKPDGMN